MSTICPRYLSRVDIYFIYIIEIFCLFFEQFHRGEEQSLASYQVYFSQYQQLAGNKKEDDDESDEEVLARYSKLFDKDFFDLIMAIQQ